RRRARRRDPASRHALALQPAGRQGARRGRHHRAAAGGRQRRGRRAGAARRHARGHAPHARKDLGEDHRVMTTDRVAGIGLALFAAVILEESWRSKLPLGSVAMPGPAYVPAVLAVALLVSGAIIAAQGAGAPRLGAVGWREWRHA